MEQSGNSHLEYLDGWRGLAIAFLLIGHFFPTPGINLGHVGVNLFFVLSGLLMSQILFVKRTPLSTFYRRRISRIIPAHLVFILAVLAIIAGLGKAISFRETGYALSFVINYFPVTDPKMPFGHIWSLAVEEHTYVFLSFVALLHRKNPAFLRLVLAIAIIGCVIAAWAYSGGPYAMQYRSEVAAFGILASALLFVSWGNRAPKLSVLAYPLLFGLGVALHWWRFPLYISQAIGVGLFAIVVNLLGAAPRPVKSILSIRPIARLGVWSFSIYLWQQPFYLMVVRGDIAASTGVALAIVCGILSFYIVERPVRAWLNRVWQQRPIEGIAIAPTGGG